MKTESDLIKLIKSIESRQLKNQKNIDKTTLHKTNLFWQGAKSELDYLYLHLLKVLKRHQKRIR